MKGTSPQADALVPAERIERSIIVVRRQKVVLDSDLAALYGVSTKRLNEQVRRNPTRFPADFAFQTTRDEYDALRSQIATLKEGRGEHRKYLPWAFTEHGALMAANVLNSPRAVQMSVYVVRAFLRLREWVVGQTELATKLSELERRVAGHDEDLRAIVQTIRRLVAPPDTPRRRIGFRGGEPEPSPDRRPCHTLARRRSKCRRPGA
jgi:hypothetical protein